MNNSVNRLINALQILPVGRRDPTMRSVREIFQIVPTMIIFITHRSVLFLSGLLNQMFCLQCKDIQRGVKKSIHTEELGQKFGLKT